MTTAHRLIVPQGHEHHDIHNAANDTPLDDLERDVALCEQDIYNRGYKLKAEGKDIAHLIAQLRASAKQRGAAMIDHRCDGFAQPTLDIDAPAAQAREARLTALRARRRSADVVEAAIHSYEVALQDLRKQYKIAVDELKRWSAPPPQKPIVPPQTDLSGSQETTATDVSVPDEVPETPAPPKSAYGIEKRNAPRFNLETAVGFESENNFYTGFSSDISEGGLFVSTINLMPAGTEIDLLFKLPGGYRAQVKAVVRWVRDFNPVTPDLMPGMGLQFVALDQAVLSRLHEFLSSRDPLFYADD